MLEIMGGTCLLGSWEGCVPVSREVETSQKGLFYINLFCLIEGLESSRKIFIYHTDYI